MATCNYLVLPGRLRARAQPQLNRERQMTLEDGRECAIVHAPWEPFGPCPFPEDEAVALFIKQEGPICHIPPGHEDGAEVSRS